LDTEKLEFSNESIASIAQKARQLLSKYSLCNSCLGRQFALLGHDTSNVKRGEALKLYLTLVGSELKQLEQSSSAIELLKQLALQGGFQPAISTLQKLGISIEKAKPCVICGGLMEKFDFFKGLIEKVLEKIDYSTFLIGSKIPGKIIDREEELRGEFKLKYGESIKGELNREIGKRLQSAEKVVDFETPDVVAVINPVTEEVELNINPLFISGRYRKLKRGISQTKWICWNCEGKGCEECEGKGLRYEHSVEVFIAEPVLKVFQGKEYSFHGAGREDIDARMLGTGRPFVVEIKEPLKRSFDLELLQTEINQKAEGNIEVLDFAWSNRGTIRNLKAQSQITEKTYQILVEIADQVTPDALKQADEALTRTLIQQKTPQRVIHRRADKIRSKMVYEFKTTQKDPKKLEIVVRCQGGCYVKELVTGDDGRTQPNLSELLNTEIVVLELDVLNVDA